jgi:hypothetical protein
LPQIFDISFVNTQKTQLKIGKLIICILPSSWELSHSIFIISQVYSNLLQCFLHQLASTGLQNNFFAIFVDFWPELTEFPRHMSRMQRTYLCYRSQRLIWRKLVQKIDWTWSRTDILSPSPVIFEKLQFFWKISKNCKFSWEHYD